MSASPAEADGRRRAEQFVRLLAVDSAGIDDLLTGLTELRDIVFLGAGLTSLARTESRRLPPAQRAQASARQVRLAELRDASRNDPDGLRTWLRQAAQEVLFIRSLMGTASG